MDDADFPPLQHAHSELNSSRVIAEKSQRRLIGELFVGGGAISMLEFSTGLASPRSPRMDKKKSVQDVRVKERAGGCCIS